MSDTKKQVDENGNNVSSTAASKTTAAGVNPSQRANKPRPLNLNGGGEDNGAGNVTATKTRPTGPIRQQSLQTPHSHSQSHGSQGMSTDEILVLIDKINTQIKAGQFNKQLADLILQLCQSLKQHGESLEHTNRAELNRVFVALRQACCRDSGSLGTACRLKMMELIELRAMGWKPTLAHSQYYLNRHNQSSQGTQCMLNVTETTVNSNNATSLTTTTTTTAQPYVPPPVSIHQQQQQQQHQQQHQHQQQQQHMPQTTMTPHTMMTGGPPISAPPFGSIPMNPFTMPAGVFPPGTGGGGHFDFAHVQHTPSYYLVPASAGFMPPTTLGQFMMGGAPPGSPLGPPPMSAPFGGIHNNMINSASSALPGNIFGQVDSPSPDGGFWPKGAVVKPSGKFTGPQRVPGRNQFRDELIIRNADSGKIMGVRGRRVAVVEELSKTVISFQKVAGTAKERLLTITGDTEKQIQYAKLLIEETIKRNVSPNRPENGSEDGSSGAPLTGGGLLSPIADDSETDGDPFSPTSPFPFSPPFASGDQRPSKIKFETDDDGSLKLSCDDPGMLQAAQAALNEYFVSRVPMRQTDATSGDRSRRKSVPSFSPEKDGDLERQVQEERTGRRRRGSSTHMNDNDARGMASQAEKSGNWRSNSSSAKTRSTPNLADLPLKPLPPPPPPLMRAKYTRDYLLNCADNVPSRQDPVAVDHISTNTPDIIRLPKQCLQSAEYKRYSSALAQALRVLR